MTFVFHGRPLCAVFLESANSNPLDEEVRMLITPGPCAETIVDTGMPGTDLRP